MSEKVSSTPWERSSGQGDKTQAHRRSENHWWVRWALDAGTRLAAKAMLLPVGGTIHQTKRAGEAVAEWLSTVDARGVIHPSIAEGRVGSAWEEGRRVE